MLAAGCLLGMVARTHAQPASLIAYPAAGQGEEQQKLERFKCHEAAVRQSRFNPRTAQAYVDGLYASDLKEPAGGGYFGQSADLGADKIGGAALGAVGGALTGDVGQGAARGVIAGTLFGTIRRVHHESERARYVQQQQVQRSERERETALRAEHYRRSWNGCMSGLGYSVP